MNLLFTPRLRTALGLLLALCLSACGPQGQPNTPTDADTLPARRGGSLPEHQARRAEQPDTIQGCFGQLVRVRNTGEYRDSEGILYEHDGDLHPYQRSPNWLIQAFAHYEDPATHEELLIIASAYGYTPTVFYRAAPGRQWRSMRLKCIHNATRRVVTLFEDSEKRYTLTLNPQQRQLVCENPDGTRQRFTARQTLPPADVFDTPALWDSTFLEPARIAQSGNRATRNGLRLTLHCANRDTTFLNCLDCGEGTSNYRYLGFLAQPQVSVIYAGHWEWSYHWLIHHPSSQVLQLYGFPNFTPDQKYFCISEFGHYTPTVCQVWEMTPQGARIVADNLLGDNDTINYRPDIRYVSSTSNNRFLLVLGFNPNGRPNGPVWLVRQPDGKWKFEPL